MTFIDADTHVDECDETWAYIPKESQYLAPKTIEFAADQIPSFLPLGYHRFWYIDGRLAPRRHRQDERTGTTVATRELHDVAARVRDMDELGVDTQIIYPTLFLHEPTQRGDVEVMLHRSYNRWMADRCADAKGRLRWVAMIPYLSEREAIEEIAFAKEHGAVGILKLGIECGGKGAADAYFHRAYEAAADHDLAVCIHQGTPWSPVNKFLSPFMQTTSGETPVYSALASLYRLKVAGKLPQGLRFGFVEAGSGWVPHVLAASGAQLASGAILADCQFYVACETFENVPYVLESVGGDDNIMVGTDYTHGDRASVLHAHTAIMERDDLDEKSALKITSQNARALYGI